MLRGNINCYGSAWPYLILTFPAAVLVTQMWRILAQMWRILAQMWRSLNYPHLTVLNHVNLTLRAPLVVVVHVVQMHERLEDLSW